MKIERAKTEQISFRISSGLKKTVDRAAGGKNKFSQFVRDAMQLFSGFQHPEFIDEYVHAPADILGISNSMFIQNVVIRYMAEQCAYEEFFNKRQDIPEFRITPLGINTGHALFEELFNLYTEKFNENPKETT